MIWLESWWWSKRPTRVPRAAGGVTSLALGTPLRRAGRAANGDDDAEVRRTRRPGRA
jgi:hypothetical protein